MSISTKVGGRKISADVLRICYFLKWQGDEVSCEDAGLLLGRLGAIYPNLKHRGQKYRYPAARATFIYNGGRI